MLSYVIPAQETTASNGRAMSANVESIRQQVPSPPRSLSLRLSSPYSITKNGVGGGGDHQHQSPKVAALLANLTDSCNERTHLLKDNAFSNPTQHSRICQTSNRSNSNSNSNINTFSFNNNARSCGMVDPDRSVDTNVNVSIYNDEIIFDDSLTVNNITASAVAFDINDRESFHQQNSTSNPRQTMTTKKHKLSKLGTNKTVGLKRVSFGSSKGSMVETLVFETPTPLSEHLEYNFGFGTETNCKANLDDSGIEVQEESERSIVRVSIYQSSQPQQICPPEYFSKFDDNLENSLSSYNYNLEDIMTTASPIPGYDRQQSTDSGWDNPFRPGGDLSREADEIVKMISGGKPITPTEEHAIGNGKSQTHGTADNVKLVSEDITKSNISQSQSAQNGTNGTHRLPSSTLTAGGAAKSTETKSATSSAQVSKQVVPGPTSASHVVIDEKKNKKKGCCVVQ